MPELTFKCPKCAGHIVEEVMVGVTVASVVCFKGSGHVDYGEQTNEGGHICRYHRI